jgi:signal transduction histidine kinase
MMHAMPHILRRPRTAPACFWLLALLLTLLPGWSPPAFATTQAAALPEPGPTPTPIQQGVIRLCTAEFAREPAGPWQPVPLPDTWSKRGVANNVRGHYRLAFTLPEVPQQMWALRLSQLSPRHEIRLNGALVSGDIERPSPLWTSRPGAHLVAVSPSLLRAGLNTIDIVVQHPSQSGLSCVALGVDAAIEAAHSVERHLITTVPLLLNAAALSFAIFLGLVWVRHRDPLLPGTVPMLWGLASARHVVRLSTETSLTGAFGDWAYYVNSVLASCVAAHLGLTLARLDQRLVLSWLYGIGTVLIAAGALASQGGQLPALRGLATPFLMVLTLAALGAASRHVFTDKEPTRRALFYSLALVSSAWVFDYTAWFGLFRISTPLAMPYLVPVSMGVLTWALLQRLVQTLAGVRSAKMLLEKRVEERTRDLRQANAAKSRFLAAASHDLRQPVVTIGLLIDLLREQAREPAQREMIDRVDEAVASMEGFLGGLLDLSRFEAGTVTPRRQRVALQHLFDGVATHALESARRQGLTLRFRPTRLAVQTDPLLLEQILRNLVSNALRYTLKGGVLVAARRRTNGVVLQVWDTGVGIAPEHQSAVFEELVQLDNPGRESSRGFGLGLAIVQRAAGLLGHRVDLRSLPGRGSCFSVELPAAGALVLSRPTAAAVHLPLSGLLLVLVDDDPAVLAALRERLAHWGAQLQSHGSLASLRAACGRGLRPAPDLLITDQRLPDGSGLQAIQWMRQTLPGLPALVVTGNTEPTELASLQTSGVPVLHKPFRAEALLQAIQSALRPTLSH